MTMAAEQTQQQAQFDKMTKTPIPRLVLGLAVPTILSMLITSIYNLADTFFVGQISTSASGAVGVVSSLMAVIQAIGFMLGHGSGSIISRSLGSGDAPAASRFASTSFFTAIGAGAALGVFGIAGLTPLMRLLGSTETILPHARDYAFYILLAAPFMMSSLVMNNILRYEGKASFAMIGLVTGGVLNMVLDPVFIFGLGMGTGGAGLATGLSQIVGFCILLSMYLRGKTVSKLSIRNYTRSGRDIMAILTSACPALGGRAGQLCQHDAERGGPLLRRRRGGRHEHRVPHLPVPAVGGAGRGAGASSLWQATTTGRTSSTGCGRPACSPSGPALS